MKILNTSGNALFSWEVETLRECVDQALKEGADLQGAYFRGADLQGAYLYKADLQGANLRGADLDFSCWPLWCGSTNVISDDRLFSQLFFHLTRLNVEECSGGVQEAMEALRSMAAADLFCEYREDIERLEDN